MKIRLKLINENRMDLVAGLCDGILTALTLAASRILASHSSIDISLALRIAVASSSSGAFIFFAAHYAQLRGELIEAERQLSVTSRGKLAHSRLGKNILVESAIAACVASVASFCGALAPLLVGVAATSARWLAIVTALLALAALGTYLAKMSHGRPLYWAGSLVLAGGALTYVGVLLNLT